MKWLRVLIAVTLSAGVSGGATPAETKIEAARQSLEKNPKATSGYASLALALASRARETGDPAYYQQAQEQLSKGLQLAPDDLEILRAMTWISLGRHEFQKALEQATALNKKAPDDLLTYAFLVDANAELGNYKAAEEACDWLLNLRPGTIPGLTRAAYLRELFGDIEGALDFMGKAYQRTQPAETEDLAWILAHVSHLQLVLGNIPAAEEAAKESLKLFPDYHYAFQSLAKVRMREGKYGEAAELYRRRYEVAPHPENLFDLGVALKEAGKSAEAAEVFAKFEPASRAEMQGTDNSNKELIFYYIDVAKRPEEALKVASMEVAHRKDVYTLDAYAWALQASGKTSEAAIQIRRALDVGTREPQILDHARAILDTSAAK